MSDVLHRVVTAIELTRITAGFGAVCDICFIVVVAVGMAGTEVNAGPGLGVPLAGALMVSIGLFGYGSILNDLMDIRHDRTFSPERPLPAGTVRVPQAVVGLIGLLILAILGATILGSDSIFLTLLVAAALMFYNATGRFIPAVGIVTIGLVFAAHMLIPDYRIPLLPAVWLIMSHVMILAVVVHLLEDKRPRLSPRGLALIVGGWLFWTLVILSLPTIDHTLGSSLQITGRAWLWPLTAMIIMALIGWWRIRTAGTRMRAASRLKRYGSVWHAVYAAAWLAGLGWWKAAATFLLIAAMGFLMMTVLEGATATGVTRMTYR